MEHPKEGLSLSHERKYVGRRVQHLDHKPIQVHEDMKDEDEHLVV